MANKLAAAKPEGLVLRITPHIGNQLHPSRTLGFYIALFDIGFNLMTELTSNISDLLEGNVSRWVIISWMEIIPPRQLEVGQLYAVQLLRETQLARHRFSRWARIKGSDHRGHTLRDPMPSRGTLKTAKEREVAWAVESLASRSIRRCLQGARSSLSWPR